MIIPISIIFPVILRDKVVLFILILRVFTMSGRMIAAPIFCPNECKMCSLKLSCTKIGVINSFRKGVTYEQTL